MYKLSSHPQQTQNISIDKKNQRIFLKDTFIQKIILNFCDIEKKTTTYAHFNTKKKSEGVTRIDIKNKNVWITNKKKLICSFTVESFKEKINKLIPSIKSFNN